MTSSAADKTNADSGAEIASYEYTIDRYYYTPQRRFEQSMDVYKPLHNTSCKEQQSPTPKVPVVLVMGSGWLGHKPYFYIIFHWWNSSAPKQICGRLGHPCVAIRHSGGYLFGSKNRASLFSNQYWLVIIAVVPVTILMAGALCLHPSLKLSLPLLHSTLVLMLVLLPAALYIEGTGAAVIEDMVSDVSTALGYIDEHAHEWGWGGGTAASAAAHPAMENAKIPVVFGGYSSGAHVAATLLTASSLSPLIGTGNTSLPPKPEHQQHPQILKHLTIRSVLYISAVLDVSPKSFLMTLLSRVVLGKAPSQVPSPLRALASSSSLIRCNGTGNAGNGRVQHEGVSLVPPHVLIGCKREVFGWSVLDSAFCASEYADALRSLPSQSRTPIYENNENGVTEISFVRLILLKDRAVNHWSILSSVALRNALRTVLASLDDRAKIATDSSLSSINATRSFGWTDMSAKSHHASQTKAIA